MMKKQASYLFIFLRKKKIQESLIKMSVIPLSTPQFSSVAQSSPTICDPMDCSTPGFPVHHQLPELTQIHVHWVSDSFQPSHPLSSPSLSVFNLSQHQGLFQWVSSLHQVAKVLELQLQHLSFPLIFRADFLQEWLVWFPCYPRDSQESSLAKYCCFGSAALSQKRLFMRILLCFSRCSYSKWLER